MSSLISVLKVGVEYLQLEDDVQMSQISKTVHAHTNTRGQAIQVSMPSKNASTQCCIFKEMKDQATQYEFIPIDKTYEFNDSLLEDTNLDDQLYGCHKSDTEWLPANDMEMEGVEETSKPVDEERKNLDLASISERLYSLIQTTYLIPAVLNVWGHHQQEVLSQCKGRFFTLGGDGRNDTPGHSAKFG
eukprot:gene943-257_t